MLEQVGDQKRNDYRLFDLVTAWLHWILQMVGTSAGARFVHWSQLEFTAIRVSTSTNAARSSANKRF
jgi:hypothetical protein